MLNFVEGLALAVLLGVVQGVTEWLPVSSKTVIMFIVMALGLGASTSYEFSIVLNGATVVSALLYFRGDLVKMLKLSHDVKRDIVFFLVVTFVTALVGIPLYALSRSMTSAGGAIVMALVSLLIFMSGLIARKRESLLVKRAGKKVELYPKDSIVVGMSQGLSALPGVSRSGVTLASLLALGYTSEASLRASFIAGIPASLGGTILALKEGYEFASLTMGLPNIVVMFLVAALTGFLSINGLTKLALRVRFSTFNFFLGSLGLFFSLAMLQLNI